MPVVVDGLAEYLRRIEQFLDLADGDATVEPSEDGLDALYMVGREQPMPLGCALRHDQTVAPLPGAQGHGIDAGQARHFTDGQPAFVQRFFKVIAEVFAGAGVECLFHQMAFRRLRFSGCGCR
ncbi:hypothetical protein D3C73_843830 [compost metagenome]